MEGWKVDKFGKEGFKGGRKEDWKGGRLEG